MTPAVSVEDVSKRFRLYHERNQSLKGTLLGRGRAIYEEFWALRDVAMEVPEGRTFGLIGENGSGKSTLLKCMARILRPDRGRIQVNGKVSALLELGAGFHPELSGRDNVYLNGSILGLSGKEIDRRFDRIVEFAGLTKFIDVPVKNYSSGMYVRLGFSVAINVEPDVLLVDEILAVGDEQFQRRCHEKFADLKALGTTIVIVTHNLGAIRNLCDTAAWLEHGRLRAVGPPDQVVDEYVEEVHVARGPDGGTDAHLGSGEARIERIELLDANGRPTTQVRTGQPVTLRLHYAVRQPLERPTVGLTIHTVGGVQVTTPNTRDAGCVLERLTGSGHVDLEVPQLLLLPGTYDVSTEITDREAAHVFDHRHRAFRFDVEPGHPREPFGGIVSLGGTWRVPALDPASSG